MKNKTKIEYRVKRESEDLPVKIFVDIFDIEDKGLREYFEKSGLIKQNENYEVISRSVFHPVSKQLENSTKNTNTYNSKFKQNNYKQQAVQSMVTRSQTPPVQSHSFFENSQEEKQKFKSLSDYGLNQEESALSMASLDNSSFAPNSPRPTSINYRNTNMDKPFRVNLHSIPFFRDNNYPQYVDVMAPTKGKSWMIAMNRVGIRHFPDGWRGLEAFEGENLADFGVYTKVNYSQIKDNNKDYNKI